MFLIPVGLIWAARCEILVNELTWGESAMLPRLSGHRNLQWTEVSKERSCP